MSTSAGVSTFELEEIWAGNVQYFISSEMDQWRATAIGSFYTRTTLDLIFVDTLSLESLEMDRGGTLDGRAMYRVTGVLPAGLHIVLGKTDVDRQVEYWVDQEKYLIRQYGVARGSTPGVDTSVSTYELHKFGEPVEINLPDMTPVFIPGP